MDDDLLDYKPGPINANGKRIKTIIMTKRKLKEAEKNKSKINRRNSIEQLEVDFDKALKGKKPKKNKKELVEKAHELTEEQDLLDEVELNESRMPTGRQGVI